MPALNTETNIKTIPAEIHFIWLGSALPEKYLWTLLQLLPIARRSGFRLNLWVDQSSNYYQSVNRYRPDLDMSIQNSFLQIKELEELKAEMRKDKFFSDKNKPTLIVNDRKKGAFTRSSDRMSDFWQCVEREMIGAKNFAAASDLLRYAILYLKGGYYFDTDTKFIFSEESKLVPEQLLLGLKANIGCSYSVIDPNNKGHAEKLVNLSSVWGNNDIIAVFPEHSIMREVLKEVISAYNRSDDLEKLYYTKTLMDTKRYQGSLNHPNNLNLRTSFTIAMSGPDLLCDVIKKFYCKNPLSYEGIKSMCGLDSRFSSSVLFANMTIKVDSTDMTWVKAAISGRAFDDSELPKRDNSFFKPKPVEVKNDLDVTRNQNSFFANSCSGSENVNGNLSENIPNTCGVK